MDNITPHQALKLLIDLSWSMVNKTPDSKEIDSFRKLAAMAELDIESKDIIINQINKWKKRFNDNETLPFVQFKG